MSSKPKPIDAWLTLLTAAMAPLTFLFAKSPVAVLACVIVMFALLVHPVWNFWWIEDRKWRRVIALGAVAVGLGFVAYAAWPESTQVPPWTAPKPSLLSRMMVTVLLALGYLQSALRYVYGWPWWWILFSGLTGAATAGILTARIWGQTEMPL